jgi:hypothetical protein
MERSVTTGRVGPNPMSSPADGPDGYWTQTTSPDGAYVWIVSASDAKMSHWIMGGALYRRAPRTKVFEAPYGWSFESQTWTSNAVIKLGGRRYPGRLPGVSLTIDVAAERGTLEADDLAELQRGGRYLWVKEGEVPRPPSGPQSLEAIVQWLEAFPHS